MTPADVINDLTKHIDETPVHKDGSLGKMDELPTELQQDLRAYYGNDVTSCFVNPRYKIQRILKNMATYRDETWDGLLLFNALMLWLSGASKEQIQEKINAEGLLSSDWTRQVMLFPTMAAAYPQLIADELGTVQVFDRPEGKIFFMGTSRINESMVQLQLHNALKSTVSTRLFSSPDDLPFNANRCIDTLLKAAGPAARELTLELNKAVIDELLQNASFSLDYGALHPSGWSERDWSSYLLRYVDLMSHNTFARSFGDISHIIAGHEAFPYLVEHFKSINNNLFHEAIRYPGFARFPGSIGRLFNVCIYKCSILSDPFSIITLRRGLDWEDTPIVWSPYRFSVAAEQRIPGTKPVPGFTVAKAAMTCVRPDTVGRLIVQPDIVGRVLN